MKKIVSLIMVICAFVPATSYAKDHRITDLTIKFIRVVGDYSAGTTFDNTIELHFTSELQWPGGYGCSNKIRVMIDASNTHMVSAAYTAYTSGMKVNINADDSLAVRSGSCELSYLDIVK